MANEVIGFEIGQWKGLPNYQCKECPWSTLHIDAANEHYKTFHAPGAVKVPVTVPILDRFGNRIGEREA